MRARVLLYGDSTWQHSSSGWRKVGRSVGLRVLNRACAGAISTGTFNREFYIMHGMKPDRVLPGVCPADTELFGAARLNAGQAMATGRQFRMGFAGKLIPRKGVDELLEAVALLPSADEWSLTIVGDGPLMGRLQATAERLGLSDRVVFHGFANTTEMPGLLASFDVVAVPSRLDLRTLVTIEAMAAGAAVVVSDATAIWGPGDLVEDGVTGLVYPSGDPVAFAERVHRLLVDRELLLNLKLRGAERALSFGPSAFASSTARAARACVGGRRMFRQERVNATTGP